MISIVPIYKFNSLTAKLQVTCTFGWVTHWTVVYLQSTRGTLFRCSKINIALYRGHFMYLHIVVIISVCPFITQVFLFKVTVSPSHLMRVNGGRRRFFYILLPSSLLLVRFNAFLACPWSNIPIYFPIIKFRCPNFEPIVKHVIFIWYVECSFFV